MGLPALDTLQIFEDLEKAGFEESQAKAISAAVRKAHETSDLATKQDIADLRKDTKQDIDDLRKDMEQGINDLRKDTKQDIADLRKDTKQGIGDLRKDMDAKFGHIEAKFDVLRAEVAALKWGLGIIGAGIVAILVKTFF